MLYVFDQFFVLGIVWTPSSSAIFQMRSDNGFIQS